MIHRFATLALAAALAACSDSARDPASEPVAGDAAAAPAAAQSAATEPPPPAFERTPAPDGAEVYIISPVDGDTVQSPVRVVFGLRGFGVVPAGIDREDAGHHHLLIDTEVPPLDIPIPADDKHVHFGLGQTETELTLPPGEHTLQLLLGDYLHVPHDPPLLSAPVTIQVTE